MALNRRLGRLLRACVAINGPTPGDVLEAESPGDFRGLADAAESHGITGYVHRAVTGSYAVPSAELALLSEYRRRAVRHHLRTIGDLRFVRRVLGNARIPWLVFKGPALASAVHDGPELRSYRDLDILVPATQFGDACRALGAAGCVVPRHNWTLLREELGGEIDVFMPSGTHLDLHWHLFNDKSDRQPYTVDLDGLFARQRDITIGTDHFATFSSADTALHVALHAIMSGAQRLIGMKDLQLLLMYPELRAERLLTHARDWRAEIPFRVALVRMERALGSPGQMVVPEAVGPERFWEFLAKAVEQGSPLERVDSSFSVGRTFYRAVRGDGRASFGFLARRAREKLLHQGLQIMRRSAPPVDSLSSKGDQVGSAEERERERFFDAVAGH